MQKPQRDNVLSNLSQEERHSFRRVMQELRAQTKSSTGRRVPAKEVLAGWGDELPKGLQDALAVVIARNEMGPKVGETPPDFNLKRLGSDEKVRLSSFKGKKPVGLVFGSYT